MTFAVKKLNILHSYLFTFHIARQRIATKNLVDFVFADHVYTSGDNTRLQDEPEILPFNVHYGYRVDQRRHVHFVLDVNDMRYVIFTLNSLFCRYSYDNTCCCICLNILKANI
jgi:hypothetical protein